MDKEMMGMFEKCSFQDSKFSDATLGTFSVVGQFFCMFCWHHLIAQKVSSCCNLQQKECQNVQQKKKKFELLFIS